MQTYLRFAGLIRTRAEEFRKVEELLKQQKRRLDLGIFSPDLKVVLRNVQTAISRQQEAVKRLSESKWTEILKEYKLSDSQKNPLRGDQWVPFEPTPPLEALLPDAPLDVKLQQEYFEGFPEWDLVKNINFEVWFQARAAWIFRRFVPEDVSLATIARLVVLTYICASFAKEKAIPVKHRKSDEAVESDELVIEATGTRLTVDKVYSKLWDMGLR